MKTIILIATFIATTISANAQSTLWGMTMWGGTNNKGVIFKTDVNGENYVVVHNFDGTNGGDPKGSLMQASNGKLYGMTADNYGGMFEFDPISLSYTYKLSFNNSTGSSPYGALIEGANGKLYGLTSSSGLNGSGTLFEWDPVNDTLIVKFHFGGTNGSGPRGSLFMASNGKMYGLTEYSGEFSEGILFEWDYMNDTFTKKHDFADTDGAHPYGSLIEASNGKLYGLTSEGGAGYGVLFEYDIATGVLTPKINLGYGQRYPYGSLVEAPNGLLYGMTNYGGTSNSYGILFEWEIETNTFTQKLSFNYTNGGNPYGSLGVSSNGKLYGMTRNGGLGDGVIFEWDTSTDTYTKKLDFTGTNGAVPEYGHLTEVCLTPAPVANAIQHFCDGDVLADLEVAGTNIQWYDAASGGNILDSSTLLIHGNIYYASQDSEGCESPGRTSVTTETTIAPTGEAEQSFCNAATISELSVNGSNIKWYDSISGGNLLNTNESLLDGTSYFASQTLNDCESSERFEVMVYLINSPDVTVIQNSNILSALTSGAAYQWLDCNNSYSVIEGETSQSFTATLNGSYAVEITQNNCADTSACYSVTTVGILENTFGNEITAYPNPTDGLVKIDLGKVVNEFTVSINDVNGKLISQSTYKQTKEFEINLNVQPGIYLLTINSGGKKAAIRLIKN